MCAAGNVDQTTVDAGVKIVSALITVQYIQVFRNLHPVLTLPHRTQTSSKVF